MESFTLLATPSETQASAVILDMAEPVRLLSTVRAVLDKLLLAVARVRGVAIITVLPVLSEAAWPLSCPEKERTSSI